MQSKSLNYFSKENSIVYGSFHLEKTAYLPFQQVLREEKDNYTALVFMGVSLQETNKLEKAQAAFKAASKINPSNPLAWNGLINHFEKIDTPEAKKELINAYISLLKVET